MSAKKMDEDDDGFDDVGTVDLDPPSHSYTKPASSKNQLKPRGPLQRPLTAVKSVNTRASTSSASSRSTSSTTDGRVNTAQSIQSMNSTISNFSSGSDDYSIFLPSTNSPLIPKSQKPNGNTVSITARGRHMSQEDGRGLRQSNPTSFSTSTLDFSNINFTMRRVDSKGSLLSSHSALAMRNKWLDEKLSDDKNDDKNKTYDNDDKKPLLTVGSLEERKTSLHDTAEEDALAVRFRSMKTSVLPKPEETTSEGVATSSKKPGPCRWKSKDDCEYVPPSRPVSQYLGELVWQVDPVVYCGSVKAVQNLNLLCRLNIEYIVDLTGDEEEQLARYTRPRQDYPCICSRKTAHSRWTVCINIRDESPPNTSRRMMDDEDSAEAEVIASYFKEVVEVIRRARLANKAVLIYSVKGRNRAPAFAAAYIMDLQRCTRVQALAQIAERMSKTRPGLDVSNVLHRALMKFQYSMGIRANENVLTPQTADVFTVKRKTAWD
ncbi:unnamed protein product [Bursaphelenchus okinawaensis]|uniref:protein-tyrosine-phosphatase n=1 Tax=Bursaphelenchus okinawaensis TaxID=465554 RepID=A0A811K1X3_9BILA|nr:unnamed protein product [Bursaphelenchus okinawaensis]CAG9089788.1 unnamed protein product [Bursaphelenchus okinawaensis]